MIYPQDMENRLGFDRIRAMVSDYCATQLAREMTADARFTTDARRVFAMQSQAAEMRTILMLEPGFPQSGYTDTHIFLKKAAVEGLFLLPEELGMLHASLKNTAAIVRFFANRKEGSYPFLERMSRKVLTHPDIIAQIERIIDEHANIRDNASPELAEIRQTLRQKEREGAKRLQSILQSAKSAGIVDEEATLSVRDGRTVIPVAAGNKRKLPGFVHDESATGRTAYIEPVEVVEINNEIRELQYREKREITRILIEFTDAIRPQYEELMQSGRFIATVDFLMAKARLALKIGGTMPIVGKEPVIALRAARHPLLELTLKKEGKEIVPLDLEIDRTNHILVISGPNAGGKSVCLKTVGLIQYMFQCGFPVPLAESSELGVFEDMFIDIGDQQSIDNDLSTYSSHLLNMKNILRHSSDRSLVLIDEFGTGTEPSVGGAIAEVILEKINKKGVFAVITTHYTNIKYFASNTQGVLNGAMAFDVQHIVPLFRLETGKPGSSFALEIARKIGLPEEVLKEAQERIGNSQINIERQLREIARDKRYWEKKRESIRLSDKRYESVAKEYETQLLELKEKRNSIIKQAKDEAARLLAESNRRIEQTIREIREAEAEKEKTKQLRAELTEFKEEALSAEPTEEDLKIERKIEKLRQREAQRLQKGRKPDKSSSGTKAAPPAQAQPQKPIAAGDKVRIKGQLVGGTVLSVDKKRATVAFGHLTTQVETGKLERISAAEFKKQSKTVNNLFTGGFTTTQQKPELYNAAEKRMNFCPDLDVRGLRVDEAIAETQQLLDDAVVFGARELRILHGKGTGALKEEIRKYLYASGLVKSAKDEHVEHGGAGITVVVLE